MDRAAFYHLYVNLNSLLELGTRQRAAVLLASLPDALPDSTPTGELTQQEADARMMQSFENLDLSALDQVFENVRNTPMDSAEHVGAAREPQRAEPGLPSGAGDDAPDLELYMQRAYSYEEELRARIDRLYARADLDVMERQITELGGPQHPLTAVLTGPQMAAWVERDAGSDETLTALVTAMRRLEMAG